MQSKAILIHGWDLNYYNSKIPENTGEGIAWSHRSALIEGLSQNFDINYYNLPGFAGNPEPDAKLYDVENFAKNFSKWKNENVSDSALIVGYSFGGAVALMHKVLTKDPTPTILISPAIFRGESLRSDAGRITKNLVPDIWESQLRHLYQLFASQYYREGTPFLRNTYNCVVRRDLRYLLDEVDPSGIFLIYGEKDTDTPWDLVKEDVERNSIGYHVIGSGAHNIGQTHPVEILEQISRLHLPPRY